MVQNYLKTVGERRGNDKGKYDHSTWSYVVDKVCKYIIPKLEGISAKLLVEHTPAS